MLMSAPGIDITYHTDGGLFNLPHLRSTTKVPCLMARDLLYTDDCALATNTLPDAQRLADCFVEASQKFGLSINVKKKKNSSSTNCPTCTHHDI